MFKQHIKAVFFDLDGTLVDTAPDMALALNIQLAAHNKASLDFSVIRPWVSHGAAALLKLGFDINPSDSKFEILRAEYLKIYANNLAVNSTLFLELEAMLSNLESRGILWGVVTNKPAFLAIPLLAALGLKDRAAAIVCGDTIKPTKPSPTPLFLACKQAGVVANQSIYVGDAVRDIQAAKSAGMFAVSALYGYISQEDEATNWPSDIEVNSSVELSKLFIND